MGGRGSREVADRSAAHLDDRALADAVPTGGVRAIQPGKQTIAGDDALRPHGREGDDNVAADLLVTPQQPGAQLGQHLVLAGLAGEDGGELHAAPIDDTACQCPRDRRLASAQPVLRRLDMPEARHAEFMDQVMSATAEFEYAEINILDGMRADFVDSWGLIRPSNTTPCLTLRFEGDDPESLEDVKSRFRKMIKGIDSSLKLPF